MDGLVGPGRGAGILRQDSAPGTLTCTLCTASLPPLFCHTPPSQKCPKAHIHTALLPTLIWVLLSGVALQCCGRAPRERQDLSHKDMGWLWGHSSSPSASRDGRGSPGPPGRSPALPLPALGSRNGSGKGVCLRAELGLNRFIIFLTGRFPVSVLVNNCSQLNLRKTCAVGTGVGGRTREDSWRAHGRLVLPCESCVARLGHGVASLPATGTSWEWGCLQGCHCRGLSVLCRFEAGGGNMSGVHPSPTHLPPPWPGGCEHCSPQAPACPLALEWVSAGWAGWAWALTLGIPPQLQEGFFSKHSSLFSCLSAHSLPLLEHSLPLQAGGASPPHPTLIPLHPGLHKILLRAKTQANLSGPKPT